MKSHHFPFVCWGFQKFIRTLLPTKKQHRDFACPQKCQNLTLYCPAMLPPQLCKFILHGALLVSFILEVFCLVGCRLPCHPEKRFRIVAIKLKVQPVRNGHHSTSSQGELCHKITWYIDLRFCRFPFFSKWVILSLVFKNKKREKIFPLSLKTHFRISDCDIMVNKFHPLPHPCLRACC